jgi:hypothetical protein
MIKNTLFLLFLLAFSSGTAEGQDGKSDKKNSNPSGKSGKFAMFGSDEVLDISLAFDITGFMKKTKNLNSFDGLLTIHTAPDDSISRDVTIKHRGVFRYENCDFPPIELNFKKSLKAYSDTGKIKKLKLVTHCESGSQSDDYILREYLVYKLFNVLTDSSFRVRLFRATYTDTNIKKSRKPIKQYGIFIEPKEIMAARTNCILVSSKNLNQKNIEPVVMDRVAIFSYMIAHWDWSVPGQHNIVVMKSLKLDQSQNGIAVPYDFDLTGVVNAAYAVTSPELGLKNIRERRFFGICHSREEFQRGLKEFADKKEKLYKVVDDFPYLTLKAKADINAFLDQFFDQLTRQKTIDSMIENFVNNCKNL